MFAVSRNAVDSACELPAVRFGSDEAHDAPLDQRQPSFSFAGRPAGFSCPHICSEIPYNQAAAGSALKRFGARCGRCQSEWNQDLLRPNSWWLSPICRESERRHSWGSASHPHGSELHRCGRVCVHSGYLNQSIKLCLYRQPLSGMTEINNFLHMKWSGIFKLLILY